MIRFNYWLSILALFLVLSIPTIASAEDEPLTSQQTFITEFQQADQSLTGPISSQTVYFQVLDYWNVDQAQINLDYQVSQLTKRERSNLTFVINGAKFHSFELTASENDKQHVELTIPKELLKTGVNTLLIQGSVSTIDDEDVCRITTTPADWLHLFKSSNVGILYRNQELTDSIKDFHKRFSGIDSIAHRQVAVLVAGKAEPSELESATYVLSSYAKIENKDDEAIPVAQLTDEEFNQVPYQIIIGLYDNLPADLQKEVAEKELGNDAQLKLINKDQQHILLVTAKSGEALIKGSRFIANSQLMSEVAQSEKTVGQDTLTDTPAIESEKLFHLNDQGEKLVGPFHQEKQFFVSLPSNRSIASNSEIYLKFRYSENLDFNRSLVTLSINGIPIGSQKLTLDKAGDDELIITVPKDLEVAGDFTLTVAFELEIQDLPCTPRQDQMPWAFIAPESAMTIHTKDRQDLVFANYPYPFLREGSYNQVAVLLPEKVDQNIYRSITALFNLLGRYAQDNTGDVIFVNAGTTVPDNTLKANNLIVLGSYQDNTVVKDLNTKLFFRYDDKGERLVSNEKISIESQYGTEIGSGQLIFSPYEEGKGILVLTGATSRGVYLSAQKLSSQEKISQHPEDGFIVDKDGTVNSFRFKKELAKESDSTSAKLANNSLLVTYLGVLIFVAGTLIAGLTFIVTKHRKKDA